MAQQCYGLHAGLCAYPCVCGVESQGSPDGVNALVTLLAVVGGPHPQAVPFYIPTSSVRKMKLPQGFANEVCYSTSDFRPSYGFNLY